MACIDIQIVEQEKKIVLNKYFKKNALEDAVTKAASLDFRKLRN